MQNAKRGLGVKDSSSVDSEVLRRGRIMWRRVGDGDGIIHAQTHTQATSVVLVPTILYCGTRSTVVLVS